MKRIALVRSLAVAVFVFGGSAYAAPIVPTLKLTDGTNTVIVVDGGVGDSNSLVGVITYIGTVGTWSLNVTTGTTKPEVGSAAHPYMDLSSVNYGDTTNLTILFSDGDFGPLFGATGARAAISGSTDGGLTYRTWWDPGNTLFAPTNPLTTQPFGPGDFTGEAFSSLGPTTGKYSLTQGVILNPGFATFDANLTVPEPSELLLILVGLGIVCMAGLLSKV